MLTRQVPPVKSGSSQPGIHIWSAGPAVGEDVAASIRAHFAVNLQRLLEKHGLTQREFASRLGINESMVSKWLSQGTFPQESSLDLIQGRFGWGYDELFRNAAMVEVRDLDLAVRELARTLGYVLIPRKQ